MPRPALHRISQPHPFKTYRDKIRLLNFLRGPDDDGWAVQFHIGGHWVPRNPAALGTKDHGDACERAIERYAAAVAGQAIIRVRKPAKSKDHPRAFKVFALPVIARLHEQAKAADADVKGKGHTSYAAARKIERDLLPRWGEVPITDITENDLNDWVSDSYKVEDVAATIAKYGTQPKDGNRQIVCKKPARTTLGNLDWAFREVWLEAVKAKVVDRRARPMIRRVDHGEETVPRAFIDAAGVEAVAEVLTEDWVNTSNGNNSDMKRMLRTYIALISCTGIRPGLEAKRIKLGFVVFRQQAGREVIIIRILARQGKHPKARSVVVYEGDPYFDIRRLLREHIAWRRSQGAIDRDELFAWPDGTYPHFRDIFHKVLTAANALTDPMTGDVRAAYSFRHFFATRLVELGYSVPQIAEWLGTSSQMVEKHYNRFLNKRNAHLVSGAQERWMRQVATMTIKPDPWESADDIDRAPRR
jgi:integrase